MLEKYTSSESKWLFFRLGPRGSPNERSLRAKFQSLACFWLSGRKQAQQQFFLRVGHLFIYTMKNVVIFHLYHLKTVKEVVLSLLPGTKHWGQTPALKGNSLAHERSI